MCDDVCFEKRHRVNDRQWRMNFIRFGPWRACMQPQWHGKIEVSRDEGVFLFEYFIWLICNAKRLKMRKFCKEIYIRRFYNNDIILS